VTAGPLAGVAVIEAGRFASAPSCGTVLADWGAEVVKLEPPGQGDPARSPGGGTSPRFDLHNRARRSIALDLTTPAGRGAFQRVIANADVFVTNMRPRALHKLDIDPESLCARHSRLVYGHISGFGIDSSLADVASYDHGGFWAYSGMASVWADERGVPPQAAGGMGDRAAGAMLAGAIAAKLLERERSGVGGLVSTSLLATGVWLLGSDVSDTLTNGHFNRLGDRTAIPYPTLNCFMAGDGKWFWLQMMEPEKHWHAFLDAVDAKWLDEDPRFQGGERRKLAAAASALVEALDDIFRQEPCAEWQRRLRAADVPFAPVQTLDEVVRDPVTIEARAVRKAPGADGDEATIISAPCSFGGVDPPVPGPSPGVGEHTEQVLRETGLNEDEIRALADAGAFGERSEVAR
jgi:crotonobetainyl-CoA:carnitine CoA-transferase CaiB-like acyl-CoA transferase